MSESERPPTCECGHDWDAHYVGCMHEPLDHGDCPFPVLASPAAPRPEGLREKVEALRSSSASDSWNDALEAVLGVMDGEPTVAFFDAAALRPEGLDGPVRLRFGQDVILDCGPTWGGEQRLTVGWVERTESLSVSGQFVHSGASREYVLQDGMDAPNEEAVERVYQRLADTGDTES